MPPPPGPPQCRFASYVSGSVYQKPRPSLSSYKHNTDDRINVKLSVLERGIRSPYTVVPIPNQPNCLHLGSISLTNYVSKLIFLIGWLISGPYTNVPGAQDILPHVLCHLHGHFPCLRNGHVTMSDLRNGHVAMSYLEV